MVPVAPEGYVATRDVIRRQLDELIPLASEYGVRVGVQPHYDHYVADSSELASLLRDYDSDAVAAIWDAAHDGLPERQHQEAEGGPSLQHEVDLP
jgi:sugar phosphate isomerase/epimerase